MRIHIIIATIGLWVPSFAATTTSTESFVKALKRDPVQVLNRLPKKIDKETGETLNLKNLRFSKADVQSGNFVHVKSKEQRACRPESVSQRLGLAMAVGDPQQKGHFFEPLHTSNLLTMEKDGKHIGIANNSPWSGDYWPIAKGVLGARNFDETFMTMESWEQRKTYVEEDPMFAIYEDGEPSELRVLSPSEKYELLGGDFVGALTANQWNQGRPYFEKNGEVALWMGICHGWAPASYMVPEPQQEVSVVSPDGEVEVPLFPAELKGLISYQWSLSNYRNQIIGRRCHSENPETDENGRVTEEDCFDVNPGTWHSVIVNHLGYDQNNFVMDATFDYEVWNQPVFEYEYFYFDPETGLPKDSLLEARIPIADYKTDIFKKYRGEETEYIVGIRMNVSYAMEIPPHDLPQAQPARNITVEYHYDLELSADNEILGGEWYSNNHPDFLWTPEADETAYSYFDKFVGTATWGSPGDPLPEKWREAGAYGSQRGHVLGTVIDRLVEFSRPEVPSSEDVVEDKLLGDE